MVLGMVYKALPAVAKLMSVAAYVRSLFGDLCLLFISTLSTVALGLALGSLSPLAQGNSDPTLLSAPPATGGGGDL
ncbi:unnamed protein product [Discosporangium mesarthrocarpum]